MGRVNEQTKEKMVTMTNAEVKDTINQLRATFAPGKGKGTFNREEVERWRTCRS